MFSLKLRINKSGGVSFIGNEAFKAFKEGKAVLASHGSHTDRTMRSFKDSINALASVSWPADDLNIGFGPLVTDDKAAGELTREEAPGVVLTFADDLVSILEMFDGIGIPQLAIPAGWMMHEMVSVMLELDAQAALEGPYASFADLYAADSATALAIKNKFRDSANPFDPIGGTWTVQTIPVTTAVMSSWYLILQTWIQYMLMSDYPNKYRTGLTMIGNSKVQIQANLSWGETDQAVITDEANRITRFETPGSLFRYLDWDLPETAALKALRHRAFVECLVNPTDSELAFSELETAGLTHTLRDI